MTYTLIHGDCLEEMSRIEDGSVDAIICDLPYGGVTGCKWDKVISLELLWKHYKRVIKSRGAIVLFGSEPFSSLLRLSNSDWYKYDWVWEKSRAANFTNAKNAPLLCHENIMVFSMAAAASGAKNLMAYYPVMSPLDKPIKERLNRNNPTRKNPKYKVYETIIDVVYTAKYPRSVMKFNNVLNEKSLHPTQKPVALLSYLIKTYTNEGDTVLDNTFGSASCGEAALRTGRRFIGIERDANYFEIGKARLERVAAELRGELTHLPMFADNAQLP